MADAYNARIDDSIAVFDTAFITALTAMPENHRDPPPSTPIR
jgi:hypothetical protein